MKSKDTNFSEITINCNKKIITFNRPVVMGILNIGPNSFYDGGLYSSPEKAVAHCDELLQAGADIIDIGAVSSKPGIALPSPADEAATLQPFLLAIRQKFPDAIISVDTCWASVAEAAVAAGANIINDISGGQFDEAMFPTVAKLQVPYVLMHTRGLPSQMQQLCDYSDILEDLTLYFSQRLDTLYSLGVKDVWLDPGFGFAKTVEQNYFLLNHLDSLVSSFREPFLVGISRKSMIYRTLGTTPDSALNGTSVLNTIALLKGAGILRVHDVAEAREVATLVSATLLS